MIVTVEMLKDYMSGIGLNADQAQGAEDILAGVQADLEHYLCRPLELQTVTEDVPLSESGFLETSVTPVVSVVGNGYGLRFGRLWQDVTRSPIFGAGTARITYTAGYDGHDEKYANVRLAIMRVAAREVEQRHDDTLSVKDLSVRNEGEMQLRQRVGWLPEELARFDRMRRRVVAT